MHLSMHTDYGLRVLVALAISPDHTASAPEMAEAYGISLHHLRKVVQQLAHAGYVTTTRGRTGGVELARAPNQIRIGDVARALETDFHIVECFKAHENTCVITPACTLQHALEQASQAFLATLDRYTLADVTRERGALMRLLSASAARAG